MWCPRKWCFAIHKCCAVCYAEIPTFYELYISLEHILLYYFDLKSRYFIFQSPSCKKTEYLFLLKEKNSDSKYLLTHELQNVLCKVSALTPWWYSRGGHSAVGNRETPTCVQQFGFCLSHLTHFLLRVNSICNSYLTAVVCNKMKMTSRSETSRRRIPPWFT